MQISSRTFPQNFLSSSHDSAAGKWAQATTGYLSSRVCVAFTYRSLNESDARFAARVALGLCSRTTVAGQKLTFGPTF